MATISDLSDELLVKILSFLPTKVAVSTSILSKQWEFLWMWCPDLEFDCTSGLVRNFINKNLPLHRAPIVNTFCLSNLPRALEAENFKSWVEIAVSHRIRELICRSICCYYIEAFLVLPSSLFTCNSLVTLELNSTMILVDVPQTVCLSSLKTLQLRYVTYSNQDSLRLLLSFCHVLEDLTIERHWEDNIKEMVIIIPSLQRLSLVCGSYDIVIVTPSLKYFKLLDYSDYSDDSEVISYSIDMPELEEADITLMTDNEGLFASIKAVKCLSLSVTFYDDDYDASYVGGIDFSQLENLKLYICYHNWSKLLFLLLKDSPNLQTLDLQVYDYREDLSDDEGDALVSWYRNQSSVPECLLKSLKNFKFEGSTGREEERDFLSFMMKHALCLKSTSI